MVHKAERSRLTNEAIIRSQHILKKSSDNFIKVYSNFIKNNGVPIVV